MLVEITTDGSCYPNPGRGGWSALFRCGEYCKVIYGCEESSTNIRMEMTAAIKALDYLKKPCDVRLSTDSEYLVNSMSKWIYRWERNGWMTKEWKDKQAKPVANQDLFKLLLVAARRHRVQWLHVKGHASHQDNITCDFYAGLARSKMIAGEEFLNKPKVVVKEDLPAQRSINLENQ